jgi:hypothetical protein
MASTPTDVQRRPFSVEYHTNVMLPDGIFDTALKQQYITCFCTNVSGSTLEDVNIYLEGVGDPGVVPVAQSHFFAAIEPGAAVRVAWLADFTGGTPGKKLVSFMAQAKGMTATRTLKRIFVSQTKQDPSAGEYTCTVEEGTLRVSHVGVIGPKGRWRPCDDRERDAECPPGTGPWVPRRLTMSFEPNPAYAGVHGDLPFSDPWWKVLAWIVFVVAAIVAIVAAIKGAGTASVTVGGTFDETTGDIDCCEPDPGAAGELSVAGAASVVAAVALAVGLSDDEDPWWRGQEATPPKPGELTVAEKVDVRFDYPGGAPKAGAPFPVAVDWRYERVTTGETYGHAVSETQTNVHVSDGVEVEVPAVHHAFSGPLVIKARFQRESGDLYRGVDLYAFALLRSPDDVYFIVPLVDDGISPDEAPNDGTYTGSIHLEYAYRILLQKKARLEGLWRVYVFAQDVNDATPDMLPEIAAKHIGGFMVASAINITFDSTLPCPLESQATVHVVT